MEQQKRYRLLLNNYYIRRVYHNMRILLKWIIFAAISGIVVGSFSTLFAFCLHQVTAIRNEYEWIIYFLPLAGIVIVAMYSLFHYKNDKGTNLVLSSIHTSSETPFKVAPLIFAATLLTHLFGGSAGREGAALQLGGSIGNQLGKVCRLKEEDKHILIMCGMSAAFSALFGTPMAAAIFSMEIVSVGVMYYAALVPCVMASLIASRFAADMGIHPEHFQVMHVPDMNILTGAETILLGVLCAGLSVVFCILLHKTGDIYRKYLKNPYVRVFVAGCLVVALTAILGTRDYLGAGTDLIEQAIQKEQAAPAAFALKMIFTAITIEAGFKGGEIVPSFFVGATFGCVFGQVLGFSPSLCAAMGMIAVFCGVTNCPITSILISFELFGFEAAPHLLLVVAISYAMSGYYGLYGDQTIVYSKYKAKYINRHIRK